MSIHINWTRYSQVKVGVRLCPTEGRRRRMLDCFQEWYGWTTTCTGCGEMWSDGEQHERPFMPRWRQVNIAHAKRQIANLRARPAPLSPDTREG